mgnify:CR=1 FL=1
MIDYDITPKYLWWRAKKIAYNLVPSQKRRKELKNALPRKWDVISYSEKNLQKYHSILKNYPDVLSAKETLALAMQKGSFSRIGDGEFNNIIGLRNSFNSPDGKLAARLKEICEQGSTDKCVVCLNNYKLPKGAAGYTWFLYHGARRMEGVLEKVKFSQPTYGEAYFLLHIACKGAEGQSQIKQLWNGQKVLIVCNAKSPLRQDPLNFFDNTVQKEFLQVPDKNAFEHYDEIIKAIRKYDTSWRIYLEVGATASVLAWDLSKEGYHALDMGDIYKRILTEM